MRKLCELFLMYWLQAWRQQRKVADGQPVRAQAPQSSTLNLRGPFGKKPLCAGSRFLPLSFTSHRIQVEH